MKLQKELNKYLSNQSVMNMKLHNLHWFVVGEGFFSAHAKLEELYNIASEQVDLTAELLLSSGMKPVASLKDQLKASSIKELEDEQISSRDAMRLVLEDYKVLKADCEEVVKLAEEERKQAIVDFMNSNIANYEKSIWMLNAFIA